MTVVGEVPPLFETSSSSPTSVYQQYDPARPFVITPRKRLFLNTVKCNIPSSKFNSIPMVSSLFFCKLPFLPSLMLHLPRHHHPSSSWSSSLARCESNIHIHSHCFYPNHRFTMKKISVEIAVKPIESFFVCTVQIWCWPHNSNVW